MSNEEFQYILKCLKSDPENETQELVVLFNDINISKSDEPTVKILSPSSIDFLKRNFQPFETSEIISRLLCVWNPKFYETDHQLQNLLITLVDDCLEEAINENYKNENATKQLLSLLSQVRLTQNKIIQFNENITKKIQRSIIAKRLNPIDIYLSLILQHNLQILQHLNELEEADFNETEPDWKDDINIALKCLHLKKHWLLLLIDSLQLDGLSPNFKNIIYLLKLINLSHLPTTFISSIDSIITCLEFLPHDNLDKLMVSFLLELERQIKICKFCFETHPQKFVNFDSVLAFARNNTCLSTLARFIDMGNAKNWDLLFRFLEANQNLLRKFNEINSKEELVSDWDISLLKGYCIMINTIKCVNCSDLDTPEKYKNNITLSLNQIKKDLLKLDSKNFQLELIENIFASLFLRYEYFDSKSKLSGFVCNELVLRDVLLMLEFCISDISMSYSRSEIGNPTWNKMQNISKYLTEALWRLKLLTPESYYKNPGDFTEKPPITFCRCEENETNMVHYFAPQIPESSESDSETKAKKISLISQSSVDSKTSEDKEVKILQTSTIEISDTQSLLERNDARIRRKKIYGKRSEIESSERSSTTESSGKSHRKFLKRSSNSEAIRERKYFLNFMLASPQSLMCLCLAQQNYEKVQQVVKMYNLENSHLALNVQFSKKLLDLRQQLKSLFDEANSDNLITEDKAESPIEVIKQVTASAYDSFQIINITEKFFAINFLPENKETKTIIEQYGSVFPFINNYDIKNEIFMHVFDLVLTLGGTYDQSITLLKCACAHSFTFEPNSDFCTFYDNVTRCHQEMNSYLGKKLNISIPMFLTQYIFPLNIKILLKQLTFLKNINTSVFDFLQIKNSNDSIYNLNDTFSQIISYINEYHKGNESSNTFNYMHCLQVYLMNLFDLFKENLDLKSEFDILNLKQSSYIGELVFRKDVDPKSLESTFERMNLDLIFHLTENCCPYIQSALDISKNGLIKLNEEMNLVEFLKTFKSNINNNDKQKEICIPTGDVLSYVYKSNKLLAYILANIHSKCDFIQDTDFNLNQMSYLDNLIALERNRILNVLFENNEVVTALHDYIPNKKFYKYISDVVTCDIHDESRTEQLEQLILIGKMLNYLPKRQYELDNDLIKLADQIFYNICRWDRETAYQYVEYITFFPLKVKSIVENLKYWSGEICIDILNNNITNFEQNFEKEKLLLSKWLKKVLIYGEISSHLDYGDESTATTSFKVASWYKVYEMCEKVSGNEKKFNPARIFHSLINKNLIKLSLKWLKYHSGNLEITSLINVEYIKILFFSDNNVYAIVDVLNELSDKQKLHLFQDLCKSLRNLKQLQNLTDYLEQLKLFNAPIYHNIRVGLKILQYLNVAGDDNLWTIINEPLLIIEQLIMNSQIEKLSVLLNQIKPLLSPTKIDNVITIPAIDELLRSYAEKALEFRIYIPSNTSGSCPSTESAGSKVNESNLLQSIDSMNAFDNLVEAFEMPEKVPLKSEWMNNNATTVCLCCQETVFSMFNRRHHCRRCGRVVCGTCSTKRTKVPTYEDILVRVCSQCYDLMSQQEANLENEQISSVGTRSENDLFVVFWQLTDDPVHNDSVRDEFSYEYAPSVSHCLSILKLHSANETYPRFLLDQCYTMLRLILPSSFGVLNKEIDYNMIVQMLRSLLIAAKVGCARSSYEASSHCDQLLGQVDIIALLATNDCLTMLPPCTQSETSGSTIISLHLQKLQKKLLEAEKWNLALEISTKAGLDKTGVFAAWGKTCLRAGCFKQARKKFEYCLEKHPEDFHDSKLKTTKLRNSESYSSNISLESVAKTIKTPSLINEIIEILESSVTIFDSSLIKSNESNKKKSSDKQMSNSTIISSAPIDPAIQVLNKLANLKNISQGNLSAVYPNAGNSPKDILSRRNSKENSDKHDHHKIFMEQTIFEECEYYLKTYASNSRLIEFYLHHEKIKKALNYINDNNLDPELYVEMYVYCLKNALVDKFQRLLIETDNTLEKWRVGLTHICRYLEQNNLLHTLYQLQLWMGDQVRAAMTCIKFYQAGVQNYTELYGNVEYLRNALEHLKFELESECQWVQVDLVKKSTSQEKAFVLKMETREIDKHISTIWRQIEINKFLAACEKSNRPTVQILPEVFPSSPVSGTTSPSNIPTLFGSKLEKTQLAVLTILSGANVTEGFGFAFRIIQDYQLNASKIYCIVAKHLAKSNQGHTVESLVDCIKTSGLSDETTVAICDEVIALAVRTMAAETNATNKDFEILIQHITDLNIKINAYIESRQLKSAYILAVRHDRLRDVRRVMREAERLNQPHIRSLCLKRLSQSKNIDNK